MQNKRYKLAVITSHPIQYQAPFFKLLAKEPDIDLKVYFFWDNKITSSGHYSPDMGVKIKWDVPLLDGYDYKFLKNISPKPSAKFFGQINPGIVKKIVSNNYDALLVMGYSSFSYWLVFLTALIKRTPIFLRAEGTLLKRRPFYKKIIKKIILGALFKTFSRFLSIGTVNTDYYKYYNVPSKKIFFSPYAVNSDFFNKESSYWMPKREESRSALGIEKEDIAIFYTGKIFGSKGPGAFDLLKSFEILVNDNDIKTKLHLIFVGDGKDKNILVNYVKENEIKNVIFAGFANQKELGRYYSVGDIMVLPSYYEQWGLVINEAMYFNNVIVASDQVGAAYDLVQDNGFIFPVGNIKILTQKLKKIISNKKLLMSMKKKSREMINDWNLEICVNGIVSALKSLNNE